MVRYKGRGRGGWVYSSIKLPRNLIQLIVVAGEVLLNLFKDVFKARLGFNNVVVHAALDTECDVGRIVRVRKEEDRCTLAPGVAP